MVSDDRIECVRALDVPADAVLAVRTNRKITLEQAERIEAQLQAKLPGRPVLVLPPDLELIVVRDERGEP